MVKASTGALAFLGAAVLAVVVLTIINVSEGDWGNVAAGVVLLVAIVVMCRLAVRPGPRDPVGLGAPYTDVRIEVPDISLYDLRPALPGLMTINLCPPAAGPEIELVFATGEGCGPVEEDFLRSEVERITRRPVLAIRRRGEAR